MNLIPLVLGFLLFKMLPTFSNKNAAQQPDESIKRDPFGNLDQLQQALSLVDLFNKLKDNKADMSQVMGEVMSNPLAMDLISRFGFGAKGQTTEAKETTDTQKEYDNQTVNQTASEESTQTKVTEEENTEENFSSADLFQPVENIAGVELTEKLKKYYDNWYLN
jgi:nucleosome binding factor SPN SPT16 subunit